MDLLSIIILGIVQGVAEFLPISSSGHLVIVEALAEAAGGQLPQRLTLNVVLHGGTLLAILIFYRRRVLALLGTERRVAGLLIVGTLPAASVGLLIKQYWPQLLESPLLAGYMLVVTGLFLLQTRRFSNGKTPYAETSYQQALAVGIAQTFGLLPGISRSGATIVAGMAVGMRADAAATFSFLLAIPAIAGACLLELAHLYTDAVPVTAPAELLLGAVISFVVGLVALSWLLHWIHQGWLHRFAYWCIPLGLIVVAWQLMAPPHKPARQAHQPNHGINAVFQKTAASSQRAAALSITK